jgi:arginyl-tRNA synthetase
MVFAVGAQAGWLAPARAEHVAFGNVLGPDKKILKSRAGEVVRLTDLLDEAVLRAEGELALRDPSLDEAARRALAAQIGIGAVKYADLANDRIKDYVFEPERMVSVQGRTGPYVQYAHARIRSIFRTGAETGVTRKPQAAITLAESAERRLALELLDFGGAVLEAAETLHPHKLCGYLYDLATAYTAFYDACPVLKAPGAATRDSRLALCELTSRVLARGLGLLGIAAPERM